MKKFSLKNIFWLGIIVFLWLGSFSFAQDTPKQESSTTSPEKKCVPSATVCCTASEEKWKPYKEGNDDKCCVGTLLNTNVPFVGQCITLAKDWASWDGTVVTEETAFPVLMGSLTKMMVTVILLISFVAILAGGVMISASGGSDSWAKKGKELIGKVIIAIAVLWASGVILRLINPNFFK